MEKEGPRKTDYLNLSALLKAEKNGYFAAILMNN